jgi:hypothetical protein
VERSFSALSSMTAFDCVVRHYLSYASFTMSATTQSAVLIKGQEIKWSELSNFDNAD